ncbi:MAG: spirocyclase AveC family protein [Solirubrobacteraceae bacterium]
MSATYQPITGVGRAEDPAAKARRRARPIVAFAGCGIGFIALQAYVYAAWILDGNAHAVSTGSTPVPEFMKISITAQEIFFPLAALGLAYYAVARPLRRERRLSWDGMWFMAVITLVWQDPLYSYLNIAHTYNSYFINAGSWAPNIPGWLAPNANRLGQPVLWDLPVYLLIWCGAIIPANRLMHAIRNRRPQIGNAGLVAITFAGFALADLVLESAFMRTGTYAYGGTYGGWTLFGGHYYGLPLFEPPLFGAVWTGYACLRFFRNDRGLSYAERGVDDVGVGARGKSALRISRSSG